MMDYKKVRTEEYMINSELPKVPGPCHSFKCTAGLEFLLFWWYFRQLGLVCS